MNQLLLGLYAEGSTDDRFLPSIISRTVQWLYLKHAKNSQQDDILVKPIRLTAKQRKNRAQSILEAAMRTHEYHALIIHADADDPTPDKARRERIDPGLELVKQSAKKVCQKLLPVIPVQAIESWMFADHEALLKELGISERNARLLLPKSQHIESIAKPKLRLKSFLTEINTTLPRRQRVDLEELYEPLGNMIRLEKLQLLPSYQDFTEELGKALLNIGIL